MGRSRKKEGYYEWLNNISGDARKKEAYLRWFKTISSGKLTDEQIGAIDEAFPAASRRRQEGLTSRGNRLDDATVTREAATTSTETAPVEAEPHPLDGENITSPTSLDLVEKKHILAQVEAYVRAHPERAVELRDSVAGIVEEHRPPRIERDLNLRHAAARIGISHVAVLRIYNQKDEDTGTRRLGEEIDGKPRFSEYECDQYRLERKLRQEKKIKSQHPAS